jgi:hypothetical protein
MAPITTVTVEISVESRGRMTSVYVLHTPLSLWRVLPWPARRVDADYSAIHYAKRFAVNRGNHRYEFTFYRSEGRP